MNYNIEINEMEIILDALVNLRDDMRAAEVESDHVQDEYSIASVCDIHNKLGEASGLVVDRLAQKLGKV